MKRAMRRQDRKLTKAEIEEIISNNAYGVLSTICSEGYPYGVPMSYAYEEGKLYFHHTNDTSLMGDNLAANSKACFTIIGKTEVLPSKFATKYESVVAFGTVKAMADTEKVAVLMRIVHKYSADFAEAGLKYAQASMDKVNVYEFTIEQVTGKAKKE